MTILAHMLAALQQRRNRAAAIRQLRRMPLHQLDDIGITPDQVEEAVDGMLRQSGHAGHCDRGIAAPSRRRIGLRGPLAAASSR